GGPRYPTLIPQQLQSCTQTSNPDEGQTGSGLGEKRFNCTYCDKSFTRFSQLKEHLRSHTGEKPFSCMQCGRSFTKQCNLIRHAVVHSGEKPYECSLCGKCFTQRSSLKSHQKTAHL
uniref:C2H2-type domain-containing protein n=1 Tax=Astatotilapia calliptera TaxID=8154 RepID=A0A3P8NQK8_ASTCA